MNGKLPVDFEQKVRLPAAVAGKGYPYQLSARDLMQNLNYLLGLIPPPGSTVNDMLYWNGAEWTLLPAPAADATYVLGVVSGVLQWLPTEAC